MTKHPPLPSEGGSFTVDASGKVISREGGTEPRDQAAEGLQEANTATAEPAPAPPVKSEEKP